MVSPAEPTDAILRGSSDESAQKAVIAFLSDPANHPAGGESVESVDTHAAIVFLCGDHAYKLKRAVKLPYLDFSTLEKRRTAIYREFEINSKITPELYLSVLPVTRASGTSGFELGGAGEAADWLLVMRRFGQDALFDSMASRGRLDRGHAVELARTIEHFHRQAARATRARFADSLHRVVGDLENVLSGPAASATALQAKPLIERLRQEFQSRRGLIEDREREGFVRHCHGDLHLRNIVLWEGKPRLFDAIEFDDGLATIDVLYDLAFLLMDLWHRGLKQTANLILNQYMKRAAISELSGLALLPLFLSARAGIRAMTGLHALAHRRPTEQDEALREIRSYVSLAENLLANNRPHLIAIGGISGTGKTSVAREIAPFIGAVPGALHIRTDVERKVMQGVPLDRPLPAAAYTPEVRGEVYRRVFKKAQLALNSGHSVIADAVFPDDASRSSLCELAHGTNAVFCGFWLEADAAGIRRRVANRTEDASDATVAVAESQFRAVVPPADWIKIDASGSAGSTAAAVLTKLWPSESR